MAKKPVYVRTSRSNPLGSMLKFEQYVSPDRSGRARCVVETGPQHYSPGGSVHGGFLFAVMDNCMGAALVSALAPDEGCATIEMKINYLKAVFGGPIETSTQVLQKGKRIAVLESRLLHQGEVVAIATSTYAIFKRAAREELAAKHVTTKKTRDTATGRAKSAARAPRAPTKERRA